jgi:hypothetical protein
MAWTYSDWVTYPRASAARVDRLAQHVREVTDLITASVQAAGTSVETTGLQNYAARLMEALEREEKAAGVSGTFGGGLTRVDMRH